MIQARKFECPEEAVQAGLRILARIIARETARDRVVQVEDGHLDPRSTETILAEVGKYAGEGVCSQGDGLEGEPTYSEVTAGRE